MHDAEGTIWKDGDETTRAGLSRPNRGYIRRTLRDMFNFAREPYPLLAANWRHVPGSDTYRVDLPEDPDKDQEQVVSAADDWSHSTPGA
ncbi:hypothetical protein ABZZ74_47870 [Streptomyces sp. NPDC006476]|uniref:hypothetical protein n=1 Tax=Streptomyces sp. NPDC006476 TaxID=3157175 RepID=UPI0033AB862E